MLKASQIIEILRRREAMGEDPLAPMCDRSSYADAGFCDRYKSGRFSVQQKLPSTSDPISVRYERYTDSRTGEILYKPVEKK